MSFEESGNITLDRNAVSDSVVIDSRNDWEDNETRSNILISNGSVQLATLIPQEGEYGFDTFNSDLWNLHNFALYDNTNNRIQLVGNGGWQEGQLEYTFREIDFAIEVTYDYIIQDSGTSGFARAHFFADGYDSLTINNSSTNIENSITVSNTPTTNNFQISISYNGETTSDSVGFTIPTDTYSLTVRIEPSINSASATIVDSGGNSASVSINDSNISSIVYGGGTDTFSWEAGHFADDGRKSVDNITIGAI